MKSLLFVRAWILVSALLSSAGWVFSLFGILGAPAYAALGIGLAGAGFVWLQAARGGSVPRRGRVPVRRFARPLALGFLALALLALLGGLLYPPNNYDSLTYRTPRVLHWLEAGRWHWIAGDGPRLDTRACGFEWMSAPLLALSHSDRLLFLLNWIPFLLLPGLLFSFLRSLRVPGRLAWAWMWLFPTGYCFLLQAGSVGNDTFAAVYVLAAVVFARRCAADGSFADFVWSLFAIALATGAKGSNLPLLLPWAVALLPARCLLLARWRRVLAWAPLALLVSFLPTAAFNQLYCGDWSGARLEDATYAVASPAAGVAGNALILAWQNLQPPVFPGAGAWNRWFPSSSLCDSLGWINRMFQPEYGKAYELASEEHAGLGLGVVLLASACAVWGWRRERREWRGTALPLSDRFVAASPWISLAAFAAKSGLATVARVASPYYPLLLPVFLPRGAAALPRTRGWKGACMAVWVAACAVLVLDPSRPLWPARTVLGCLQERHPASASLARARSVYEAYAGRADALAPLRAALPPGERRIAFLGTGDDPEASLWRPFGSRTVVAVTPAATPASLAAQEISYLVVNLQAVQPGWKPALVAWASPERGEVVWQGPILLKLSAPPSDWRVVRLRGPGIPKQVLP